MNFFGTALSRLLFGAHFLIAWTVSAEPFLDGKAGREPSAGADTAASVTKRFSEYALLQKAPPTLRATPATLRATPAAKEVGRRSIAAALPSQPTVPGKRAVLKNGIAYAPADAPLSVKKAIWATNGLRRKPYLWGGGHGSFVDRGYDCSGTVSYALHHAGVLNSPMPSIGFMDYGRRGQGRWITVYSRRGHAFAVIAGLRLDTTGFREKEGPRWRSTPRSPAGFKARHPAGL